MSTITYAKVDGPPENWWGVRVVDLDAGCEVMQIIEVNSAEGWLVRHVTDGNGRLTLNAAGDAAARERITGRFLILAAPPS